MLSNQHKFYLELLVPVVLVFGVCFLLAHAAVTYGAVKEREAKECVGATAIQSWEETLSLAKAICVDGQKNFVQEINRSCEDRVTKAEDEAKKWKDSYNWLNKKMATSTPIN